MGKMTRANFMENNGSEAQLSGEVESLMFQFRAILLAQGGDFQ
jgi:hypothetical protein